MRARRFDLGWTQARLAAALGVRPSEVARWEREESLPPAATIRAAARVLGASPESARSWLEEVGEAPTPAAATREIPVGLPASVLPADPFQVPPPASPAADRPVGATRRVKPPVVRPAPTGVVFPGSAPVVVYSSGPLESEPSGPSMGRMLLTSAVLVALGAVLWWAFGQLGTGLAGIF